MKYLFFVLFLSFNIKSLQATPFFSDTTDLMLQSLEKKFNGSTTELKDSIKLLNDRIQKIDSLLAASAKVRKRADSLQTRIELLEIKAKLSENIITETYSYNYGAALSNLFGMQKDLKTINLLNAAIEFTESVTNISNPNSYKEFTNWYTGFAEYIEKNKEKDARFTVLSNILSSGKQKVGTIPQIGPIAIPLFNGISRFIDLLSKKDDRQQRQKATEMLTLISRINQFDYAVSSIESDWIILRSELDSIQTRYTRILTKNISKINLTIENLNAKYIDETLESNRFMFIRVCIDSCTNLVIKEKLKDENNWKNFFYGDMIEVQSLRIQFGMLIGKMAEYLKNYEKLLKGYDNDNMLKDNVIKSLKSLKTLQDAFTSTFSPIKYIEQSTYMYKIL